MRKVRRNDILLKNVAEKLKKIRQDKGVTQLSVLVDTEVHVGRLENNPTNISLSTLADLCTYYGLTLEEFFKDMPIGETSYNHKKHK